MHDDRTIIESRLRRLVAERINPARYGARVPFDVSRWEAPGEPVSAAEAATKAYVPFAVGEAFGRPWGTTWFRMSATIPDSWAGGTVSAIIDLGFTNSPGFQSEGLLWALGDGGDWEPLRAVNPLNRDVPVLAAAKGGERVEFTLEAASNPEIAHDRPDPNSDLSTASTTPIYSLTRAELVVVNSEVIALRHDVAVLDGLMRELPFDQPRRHEILRALDRMMDCLDLDDIVGSAAVARAELAEVLSRPAVASAHRISAIGHAHIDSAWLWPIRETIRKCARTFSNVLALVDRYPEFRGGCSQAVRPRCRGGRGSWNSRHAHAAVHACHVQAIAGGAEQAKRCHRNQANRKEVAFHGCCSLSACLSVGVKAGIRAGIRYSSWAHSPAVSISNRSRSMRKSISMRRASSTEGSVLPPPR